ncbi:MAG: FAD-binding oxidoreductase [Verrucomicrobia bacterium]|nr:FAD-binding oxidoreductase [Verrucomicrobiota bacterium]
MSLVAYAPDDLTVSVTADTTLAALQKYLARRGQWLPVDPPHPDRLTIGAIIDGNLSGPRRYGYGTVREHVLSLRAELADGRRIKTGADVVKNAAGYDLCRLFTGARGELASVREVCFKVQPLPEVEQFVEARFPSVEAACAFVEILDTSELTPVVLDLHHPGGAGLWTVVAGLAGMREDVAWQRQEAERLGTLTDSSLDHDRRFWAAAHAGPVRKLAVLPSALAAAIQPLRAAAVSLVARAGNGILYYHGGPEPPAPILPVKLLQRLKHEFDPTNKFPAGTS